MIRPLELAIGLRYTRAKRRNHFISFISLASMLGIALGIMALITVLSVMNGFQKELQDRMLSVTAHATISGSFNNLSSWQKLDDMLKDEPHLLATAPYVLEQGMVSRGKTNSGVLVRGIDPVREKTVSELADKMTLGSIDDLKSGTYSIILGKDLAWKLQARVGARVALIVPQGNFTPAGSVPRIKRFTVVGVFESGHYEYDSALVLINIDDARKLFKMGDNISGLRLKLDDLYQAPLISRQIASRLDSRMGYPGSYRVRDWSQQHASFFRALKMEKRVMSVILFLIVAVAAFNIVSTMVMVVTDKQSEIAILRTLGMSPRSVMNVFMVQGTVIGIIGTLLGTVLGVLLALNLEPIVRAIEKLFGVHFLDPKLYFITELPSDLHLADVVTIALTALLMTMLATLYPAWRASRTQPAEALRYE